MSYSKEINKMTFSFSRLNLFCQCKYAWYKKYIEQTTGIGSYYTENGSLMHKIGELLAKHELPLQDAPTYYIDHYEDICYQTKQSTMDNTFDKCLDFLCETDGIDENKYEILGVEKEVHFKIGKYDFVGYIDLLLRNKETQEIIICDYKSASHFLKKNGEVLKSAEKQFSEYSKQMYLYSKPIFEEYGVFPSKICWIHFKDSGALTVIDFNEDKYAMSLQWAEDVIRRMKKETEFGACTDWFYCKNLCDFREDDCEYLEEENSYI